MRLRSEPREGGRPAEGSVEAAHGPLPVDAAQAKRELLEALVEAAAGTQEGLAEALGISYATLHAWKTDRREVPDRALEGLAREALRRSRVLTEAGSRLQRLADAEASVPARQGGDLCVTAAGARPGARAVRERMADTTARARPPMERPRNPGR